MTPQLDPPSPAVVAPFVHGAAAAATALHSTWMLSFLFVCIK